LTAVIEGAGVTPTQREHAYGFKGIDVNGFGHVLIEEVIWACHTHLAEPVHPPAVNLTRLCEKATETPTCVDRGGLL
tara:strand:- start:1031 stop:1261 length:231 start_codon:yes stop_codon:yes gene_type:complete